MYSKFSASDKSCYKWQVVLQICDNIVHHKTAEIHKREEAKGQYCKY